jgi:putative IMPACT (imprinted ancient) family translation regulator
VLIWKDVKNVMVIVSRWYGGILLHGDRFKHISNAAREAVDVGGFLGNRREKTGAKRRGKKPE